MGILCDVLFPYLCVTTDEKRDDVEAEQAFSQFLELHVNNLLGDFSTKIRLVIFSNIKFEIRVRMRMV
jgi:hypothetical protein